MSTSFDRKIKAQGSNHLFLASFPFDPIERSPLTHIRRPQKKAIKTSKTLEMRKQKYPESACQIPTLLVSLHSKSLNF